MKKICVVTTTRAEYGLLYWLMKAIDADAELQLQLLVTGMHLSPEFGSTWKMIEADGFVINEKVDMLLSGDSPAAIAKSIGLGTIGMADALARLKPDLLVLLGDRFEALAAAQTALVSRVPIAHLHGGEVTEGAIDESIRHAITKMSNLHFVAAEPYRQRVIQLGEHPDRVFNVGAPGLEAIGHVIPLTLNEMERQLGIDLKRPFFLVTYHPATLEETSSKESMKALLDSLRAFPEYGVVFSYPNADAQGRELIEMIKAYCADNPSRCVVKASLGQQLYLSLMKHSLAVVGNSSSGIIEAPSMQCYTINIGSRQKGRLCAASVVHCDANIESITQAIRTVSSKVFNNQNDVFLNPYGQGQSSLLMVDVIKNVDLKSILTKPFYNLPGETSGS